jgi:CRISPR-associated exonuclease Cas4
LYCVFFDLLWGDFIELLFLGIFLIICAIIIFLNAIRIRFSIKDNKKSLGIPDGKILYSDLNTPAKPFFSKRSRLVGKPDYIVKKNNFYIPVEVKSGLNPHPHRSNLLQLAAYCQIFEDIFGEFVSEGILVYNNQKHIIPFDPKLRFELGLNIKAMRASLRKGVVQRNHEDISRCRYCSMKKYCSDPVHQMH